MAVSILGLFLGLTAGIVYFLLLISLSVGRAINGEEKYPVI